MNTINASKSNERLVLRMARFNFIIIIIDEVLLMRTWQTIHREEPSTHGFPIQTWWQVAEIQHGMLVAQSPGRAGPGWRGRLMVPVDTLCNNEVANASKWRQFDIKCVKMTFWRYNDVIITSCVQWDLAQQKIVHKLSTHSPSDQDNGIGQNNSQLQELHTVM